jgi:hypothetical protein
MGNEVYSPSDSYQTETKKTSQTTNQNNGFYYQNQPNMNNQSMYQSHSTTNTGDNQYRKDTEFYQTNSNPNNMNANYYLPRMN